MRTLNAKQTKANNIGNNAGNKGKENNESDSGVRHRKDTNAEQMGKMQPITNQTIHQEQ